MPIPGNVAPVLRGHHLFGGLDPKELERVLATGLVEDWGAGQVLFDRGQPARNFFLLLEGQVKLALYSRAGEEKIVEILGPGRSFAEALMFMRAPAYPLSAVATLDSCVARFSSDDYLAVLRESNETCLRMLGHLSQRLHMRLREIENLTLESATHRLVRLIDERLPKGVAGPAEIELAETRQDLASRLSMKPETLSRILRHLSDADVIAVQGRTLSVPDRSRLLAVLDSQP
jgi:CRP-like cAMP-binding protein